MPVGILAEFRPNPFIDLIAKLFLIIAIGVPPVWVQRMYDSTGLRVVRLSLATAAVLTQSIALALGIIAIILILTFAGHSAIWMADFAVHVQWTTVSAASS